MFVLQLLLQSLHGKFGRGGGSLKLLNCMLGVNFNVYLRKVGNQQDNKEKIATLVEVSIPNNAGLNRVKKTKMTKYQVFKKIGRGGGLPLI